MRHTNNPYSQFCAKLRKTHLLRHLPRAKQYQYDFSNNDYLGLSQHPALIQAAIVAADKHGVGSKASRLISSDQAQINALESAIATSKQSMRALIFNSGFQANISVLSALLDQKVLGCTPLVFSDRLNHASMHAACQLAKVKQQRFHHLDYDHLEFLLQQSQSSRQPKFILTESVFGMDGDVADLEILIKIAKQYGAMLYVDEAHATGLFGKNGYGLTQDYGSEIDVTMGTFSKALGGSGAYVTCSQSLKRYFINRCQGLIFSTAPSPMQIAAMQAAWVLIPHLQNERKNLFKQAHDLRVSLQQMGFDTGNSTSHIIPVILRDAALTIEAQRFLAARDIRVSAIRPPSVGPNLSRLRIALTAAHSEEAIEKLKNALYEYSQVNRNFPSTCRG